MCLDTGSIALLHVGAFVCKTGQGSVAFFLHIRLVQNTGYAILPYDSECMVINIL